MASSTRDASSEPNRQRLSTAQRALRKLGYSPGRVDGKPAPETTLAIRDFRRDEPGLKNKGWLDAKVQDQLSQAVRAYAHDAFSVRITRHTRSHLNRDRATGERVAAQTLGLGDNGPEVANIQHHLKAAGFDPRHTHGKFDQRTRGAVRAFQRAVGLGVTGFVDAATWEKLEGVYRYHKKSAPQALGERSPLVLRSERALATLGYDVGKVDGHFDAKTQRAVRAFEKRRKGFRNDGEISGKQFVAMEKLAKKAMRGPFYPLSIRGSDLGGAAAHRGNPGNAGLSNWESLNAVDLGVPVGTPVYAMVSGTIGREIGPLHSSNPRLAGERLHLHTKNNEYYYAHLSRLVVRAGQRVRAGQLLGYSGSAAGSPHLHLAVKHGDPEAIVRRGRLKPRP